MTRRQRWFAAGLLALVGGLVAVGGAWAGKGNGIPPGVNPFEYLLGLIAGLQAQVDALGGGEEACGADLETVLVGTWSVDNVGDGLVGQVTFAGDGTYTIDSGDYSAGGSWFPATSGTWTIVAERNIGFVYDGWVNPAPFSRFALVQCAGEDEIVHHLQGHTHDLEILTRVP
jgi:hypothetical protein